MGPPPVEQAPAPRGAVSRYSEAFVPTEYGRMQVIVYHEAGTPHEHCAIVFGDVVGKERVLARVHSECFTGEVLHSLKCDCREQLDYALSEIAREGAGLVMYLRQEGRGIGLGNKIRAYALQEGGADTVDANRMLGLPDDVRLMTNNPTKVAALSAEGIQVERVAVNIPAGEENAQYLLTKKQRMGHLL